MINDKHNMINDKHSKNIKRNNDRINKRHKYLKMTSHKIRPKTEKSNSIRKNDNKFKVQKIPLFFLIIKKDHSITNINHRNHIKERHEEKRSATGQRHKI